VDALGGSLGGGVPVAVTYCPLCNSGLAFDRRAAGRMLTFGTSGKLYASNLVMYDRQTESLWPQLTGQAALGLVGGATLASFPLAPGRRTSAPRNPRRGRCRAPPATTATTAATPTFRHDEAAAPLFDAPGSAARNDARLEALERIVAIPARLTGLTELSAHPADAPDLRRIHAAGIRLITFTNGAAAIPESMLDRAHIAAERCWIADGGVRAPDTHRNVGCARGRRRRRALPGTVCCLSPDLGRDIEPP
jgi:Protein of unknown function (DUF3179)